MSGKRSRPRRELALLADKFGGVIVGLAWLSLKEYTSWSDAQAAVTQETVSRGENFA